MAFFNIYFFKLNVTYILKSGGWSLENSQLPWEQNFFLIAVGALPEEILAQQVSIVQDSFIFILDIILGWVYDVTSMHILHIFKSKYLPN